MSPTPQTRQVESNLKPDGYGYCECDHDRCVNGLGGVLYGRLRKTGKDGKRHVYNCKCPSCTGKRSRDKGDRRAARARKALKISGVQSRHEEHWGGSLRIEVKSGAQIKPAVTAFEKCAAQSEASRPVGDNRVFAAVMMPDGATDGIVSCRLSQVYEFAAAVLENQASS